MSIKGYFESIINTWNSKEKITPAMRNDMKVVLNQFNNSCAYGDLTIEEYNELKKDFDKIYKEVYR
jgi:formylmethanofuran dehydrogenase subunit E-like metal-binding protein